MYQKIAQVIMSIFGAFFLFFNSHLIYCEHHSHSAMKRTYTDIFNKIHEIRENSDDEILHNICWTFIDHLDTDFFPALPHRGRQMVYARANNKNYIGTTRTVI